MVSPTPIVYSNYLITYILMTSVVSGLILNQETPKPRHTKFSNVTTDSGNSVIPSSTTVTKDDSGVALYRLINSRTGATCILLKTDALVEVKFKIHDVADKVDSFIPEKPLIEGNCKNEDVSYMRISWPGYGLVINFAKTPGGERWYISSLELSVNSEQLRGLSTQGKPTVKLYHRQMLTPTPIGKSYTCEELDVDLETDDDDNPPPDLHGGTILFRLLQVQSFMYRGENFEPEFECKSQKSFKDETTPIAVGSTLAIAVLMTVTGYGIYRYFKVKNVQYNTME